MGHSQAEKAQTHERIVRIAAQRFREKGVDGIGVADLMKEAGLTVGGFYKHFGSRDDLVAEAVDSAFGMSEAYYDGKASADEKNTFAHMVEDYLSQFHRDNPGTGCAVSALIGDIPRCGEKTRSLCTEQIRRNFDAIAGLLAEGSASSRRAQAILAYCAMIGAMGLSRAVSDEALSLEILETVEKFLINLSPDEESETAT